MWHHEPVPRPTALDRDVLGLALPSLGTLMAEPLLLAADTAMVGHLGTAELAGLALATTLLTATWGVFIFLTYTTTASASHALGAGDRRGAVRLGVSGMWLAAALGVVLAAALLATAPLLVSWMGAEGDAATAAVTYLRTSAPGLVGLLVVLAGTGTLRGLMDARTPFVITVGGAVLNVALNAAFIYGLGLGIAGAALGTATSQTLMATLLVARVAVGARALGVSLRPSGGEVGATWMTGLPLLIRTVALRGCLIVTVLAATRLGEVPLAAHHVVSTLYGLASYPADALGISAQSLVGHALGAGDGQRLRAVIRRCLAWAVWPSVLLGALVVALAPHLAPLFTSSTQVAVLASDSLVVVGALLPVSAVVFCLDGVLIGAQRSWFLAAGTGLTFACFAPAVLASTTLPALSGPAEALATLVHPGAGVGTEEAGRLVLVWASFMLVLLGVRAVTNGWETWRLGHGAADVRE